MLRNINKRAQTTAEYIIVLGLIVAVVVGMQTYIKRAFNSRIKDAVDFVDQGGQASQVVQFTGGQYEPYYLSSSFDSARSSTDTENLGQAGAVNRTVNESSTRTGQHTIGEVR
jgi:hypothetical protein